MAIGAGRELYGTTANGGAGVEEWGTVFSLIPVVSQAGQWTESVLHSFGYNGSIRGGDNPQTGLAIGAGGVLYGTTASGGTVAGTGVVYSLTPASSPGTPWKEKVLHTFAKNGDGFDPQAGVVIGPGKILYGTTVYGGTAGYGMVFSLTPPSSPGGAWTEALLHSFKNAGDGGNPIGGLAVGDNGVLYGTTAASNGSVFELKVY